MTPTTKKSLLFLGIKVSFVVDLCFVVQGSTIVVHCRPLSAIKTKAPNISIGNLDKH